MNLYGKSANSIQILQGRHVGNFFGEHCLSTGAQVPVCVQKKKKKKKFFFFFFFWGGGAPVCLSMGASFPRGTEGAFAPLGACLAALLTYTLIYTLSHRL